MLIMGLFYPLVRCSPKSLTNYVSPHLLTDKYYLVYCMYFVFPFVVQVLSYIYLFHNKSDLIIKHYFLLKVVSCGIVI